MLKRSDPDGYSGSGPIFRIQILIRYGPNKSCGSDGERDPKHCPLGREIGGNHHLGWPSLSPSTSWLLKPAFEAPLLLAKLCPIWCDQLLTGLFIYCNNDLEHLYSEIRKKVTSWLLTIISASQVNYKNFHSKKTSNRIPRKIPW